MKERILIQVPPSPEEVSQTLKFRGLNKTTTNIIMVPHSPYSLSNFGLWYLEWTSK